MPTSQSWSQLMRAVVPDAAVCPFPGDIPEPPADVVGSAWWPGSDDYRRAMCIALCGRNAAYDFTVIRQQCVAVVRRSVLLLLLLLLLSWSWWW
jgi:hypothetical protein